MSASSNADVRPYPDSPSYGTDRSGCIVNLSTMRPLKQTTSPTGYVQVVINLPTGSHSTVRVATIVCRTFHGVKPTETHSVDHINRIKTDNRAENLRWATKSEQCRNRAKYTQNKSHRLARKHYQLDMHTRDILMTFNCAKDAVQHVVNQTGTDASKVRTCIKQAVQTGGISMGFRWSADPPPDRRLTSLDGEEWKLVAGASRQLSVSNIGRVSRMGAHGHMLLVHCPSTDPLSTSQGYYQLIVEKHIHGIHTLIASAFLGPRPHNAVVHHNDGDKLNNAVDNLSYRATNWHSNKRKAEDDVHLDSTERGSEYRSLTEAELELDRQSAIARAAKAPTKKKRKRDHALAQQQLTSAA